MIEPHEARTQFGTPVMPIARNRAPRASVHGLTYAQVAALERAAFARNGRSPVNSEKVNSDAKLAQMLALLGDGDKTMGDLQTAMGVVKSTITYLRNELESTGLVEKYKPKPGAKFMITLTAAGRGKLGEAE